MQYKIDYKSRNDKKRLLFRLLQSQNNASSVLYKEKTIAEV